MGYTRYWERTAKEFDEKFVKFCNEVFRTCAKLGITIRNQYGDGYPVANLNHIAFNGEFRP